MISPQSLYDRKKMKKQFFERILKPVSQAMDAILIADTGSQTEQKRLRSSIRRWCMIFPGVTIFSAPRNFSFWKKSAPITGCGWMRMMS